MKIFIYIPFVDGVWTVSFCFVYFRGHRRWKYLSKQFLVNREMGNVGAKKIRAGIIGIRWVK